MDDDFETFEDGVNIIIYSKQGELLAGNSPTSFNKRISLKSDEIQIIKDGNKEWIVYDFLHNADGGEQVWVRNNDDEPIIINDEYTYRINTDLISITYSHCGSGRIFYYAKSVSTCAANE